MCVFLYVYMLARVCEYGKQLSLASCECDDAVLENQRAVQVIALLGPG